MSGFLVANKDHLFSDYDYNQVISYPPLDVFVEANLGIHDYLNSGAIDQLWTLQSINDIPSGLIQHLSSLVGWRQTDFNFNFLTFRDLVKNIVRIYKIKGTPLSYDVFFRALGYTASITECWWNQSGQISLTKPIGAPDPTKPNNILNKSNFLQIALTLNYNDPNFPEPLTSGPFLQIMLEYLTFLKPIHIRYLPIDITVPPFKEVTSPSDPFYTVFICGDTPSPLGIGRDGLFDDTLPGQIVDDFQIYSLVQFEEKFPMLFNAKLRAGTSVAQMAELNGISFPFHITQRAPVRFNASSPIPDDLRIITQLDHAIGPERFELRFNAYTLFNAQTKFDPTRTLKIDDAFRFDSQDISFGFGDVFGAPAPLSGEIIDNRPGYIKDE